MRGSNDFARPATLTRSGTGGNIAGENSRRRRVNASSPINAAEVVERFDLVTCSYV